MKRDSVLPISRSESSGSNDEEDGSMYSFSLDSVSTSPPPASAAKGTVSLETSDGGFQDLTLRKKSSSTNTHMLSPKQLKSNTTTVKEFLWKLYMTFPFLIISIFGVLILYEQFGHHMSNHIDGLYRPDLPSSFESASGTFDHLNIEFYDLNDYKESANGWQNGERILFCVPLRDASQHLPMFFNHMRNLTYPHNLIDLAFLISDTTDSTIKDLKKFLKEFQTDPDLDNRFGRINIYEKDFGQIVGQTFSDRHGFALQGPRRKLMAIARNWLLSTALRPDHSWVYWRDIDVETCPGTIIEDLMHHNKDVIVPNVWRPLPDWLDYEQPYDLNSWQESEGGIELLDRLDEDAVIVEGYSEYATWRPHLAYLRDPNGDPEVEMELDGIGGVSILAKANVFKSGAHFPAFSFQKHAETELFGKLCKYMGFSVIGLPHYTIWHIYEPSSDDLKHMEWMAKEEQMRFEKLKLQKVYDRTWKLAFEDVSKDWDLLKFNVFKNTDLTKFRQVDVDWNEVDEYLQDVNDQTINYEHFINEKEEEVRNYDANDPAKFIYNKYSHKKSEIDLRFKLNEFDKQKNFIPTDDVINYGMNKGEDLFGSFPINPYLSGNNPKSMRFVKFKKNEVFKFDEPDTSDIEEETDKKEDEEIENKPELSEEITESPEVNLEIENEIKQEDQIEPSKEEQQQKSKQNLRQDAMALVVLKQKLAKKDIENSNKQEKIDSIQQLKDKKIDPVEIKQDKEKILKKQVLEKQQEINKLAANKKKEETDQSVNLNKKPDDSAISHDAEEISADLELAKNREEMHLEKSIGDKNVLNKVKNYLNNPEQDNTLAKVQEEIELANDIQDEKILQKLKNYENDKIAKDTKNDLDSISKEGGLMDDINIGSSKDKLSKDEAVIKDDIIIPKRDDKPVAAAPKRKEPLLE